MEKHERLDEVVKMLKHYHKQDLTAVAASCSVSRQYLSDLCSGRRELTEPFLLRLSLAYPEVNVSYITDASGDILVAGASPEMSGRYVDAEAWDMMQRMVASLESRDRYLDRCISLLESCLKKPEG